MSDSNTDIKKRISDILPRISTLLSEYHATYTKTGLFEGELGAALYQSHYYVITKDEKVLNLIYEHLGRSIHAFNNASQSFNLADGIAGMMWIFAHLKNLGILSAEEMDVFDADMGNAFKRSLDIDIKRNNYDLLYGYIGKIIALIEIGSQDAGQIERAIDILCQTAIWEDDGCYWIDPDYKKEGIVNLGLAHGLPGILVFLLKWTTENQKQSNKMSVSIANWIASSASESYYSRFSTSVRPGAETTAGSRLAWCYGDLGVTLAFLAIDQVYPNKKWKHEIYLTINALKKRTVHNSGIAINKNTGLMDIGFCHGTSGIAHQFNKIYHLTGEIEMFNQMHYWIEHTIINVEANLTIYDKLNKSELTEVDLGLLNGIVGAGLVLLSFLEPEGQDWDRIFLLN